MKLIINGDDFGMSKGCNYGIIDAYQYGVLTSTSLMVNMNEAQHAAELMNQYPTLSVGLHLNITVGLPLTSCNSLCNEFGSFNSVHSSNLIEEEVIEEFETQYQRFIKLTGKHPRHINTHHFLERNETFSKVLIHFSKLKKLPLRDDGNGTSEAKLRFIQPIDNSRRHLDNIRELFTEEEISSNQVFELMVHPAYIDNYLLETSSLKEGRVFETQLLQSIQLREWIEKNKIMLMSY